MGVQHLNSLLRAHCPKAITRISLSDLSGKKIAIDTSIYMYRFLEQGSLIENMFVLVSMLLKHNITPVFVFDGKAPLEKKELLKVRKEVKDTAEKEYKKLNKLLNSQTLDEDAKQDIMSNMDNLRTKFTRLQVNDVDKVKGLLTAMGILWLDAQGEADGLCAKLVIKKLAYACLSEDMDMFIYGCPMVLRHISLVYETVIMYDLSKIVSELSMTTKELQEICVASGTDYNYTSNRKTNIHLTLKLFRKYKKSGNTSCDFYKWLDENTEYIDNVFTLYNNLAMFDLSNIQFPNYINIKNKHSIKLLEKNDKVLRNVLEDDGFFFPK
jgi:flap endonuclease-1